MELKTKYQYTYFIYPFVVKESKYTKYLLKMLKDEHTHLKIFEKEAVASFFCQILFVSL